MKAEKSQTLFIHWLNAVLKDPRWRAFIRARLRESELPVIDLAITHGGGPRHEKPASPNPGSFTED